MINPIERCISYEIMENNVGFKSYMATIEVLPINGDGQNGCKIEWSFVADPIEGWRLELPFLPTLNIMKDKRRLLI